MGEPRYGAKCFRCQHVIHDGSCSECSFCKVDEFLNLMFATHGMELFEPEVRAAVKALHAGEDHPLLDRLRAEIQAEEAPASGKGDGSDG